MLKSNILIAVCLVTLTGCSSNEKEIEAILKNNPKILFNLIEENPEQFVETVNKAAQKVQQKQYEKQISELKMQQENDLKNPKKPKLNENRLLTKNLNGDITIVEYADFQCPACKMAYDTLNEFKSKYKDRVRFYYKHMPLDFHKMAYPGAQFFEAIKIQDKVKAVNFFNILFQNQKKLTSIDFLEKAAKDVGADLSRLKKDIQSETVKNIISEDITEFEAFGFTGTPVIIINGVAMHGAQRLEDLERVLQLTIKKDKQEN